MAKSKGQIIVEAMEAYLLRFVVLPENMGRQSLVIVLWAIHTWMYERFPASPRLVFTAATKEAGKTLCMEVLGAMSRGAKLWATLRPLMLLRWAKSNRGHVVAMIDEAEKLSSGAIGDVRSIFSSGANRGGTHGITAGAEGYVEFSTFWPAAFALIGDVMDVVRSRSITLHCERSDQRVEDFRGNREECESEALPLVDALREYFGANEITGDIDFSVVPFAYAPPSHLVGREREFWAPLFSIAAMMDLDAKMIGDLVSVSMDLVNLKALPPRELFNAEAEDRASSARDAERAMADLASVIREGEPAIFSAVAVERMRAIPEGPWRTYRGVGLTVDTLALLTKAFGVRPRNVRMVKGKGASKAKMLSGYSVADVMASVPKGGK